MDIVTAVLPLLIPKIVEAYAKVDGISEDEACEKVYHSEWYAILAAEESSMSKEKAFSIESLEYYKRCRNLTGAQAHDLFMKHGVFAFLEENYECLHTVSYHYVNDEIDEFIQAHPVKD